VEHADESRVVPLLRRRPLLIAAAAVVVSLAVAGTLVAADDDPAHVVTEPAPPPRDTSPDTTDAPGPSTTPSTEPSSGSPGASTPETTAPPVAGSRPAGPIVSVEGILGTWSGSGWVRWEPGATPPTGDEYQLVRLGDPITTAVGEQGTDCSPAGLPTTDVGLRFGDDTLTPPPIAVAGVADPRPRPVEVLDPSAAVYRDAAAAVVAGLGIQDPAPQVRQAVRGDLDGDGSAEVVVVAERISDPTGLTAAEGDYAVVFLRRVVGGDVQTSVIASSVPHPQPDVISSLETYRVAAFADLNGDGRMEIVLSGTAWEQSWTAVHELRSDGSAPEVLTAGCGA
jgi:FG-GAP-like repeat